MDKRRQQPRHHTQRRNRHRMHDADAFYVHARRFDVAQEDVVQENRTEAVRQEHISRHQTERNHTRHQAAVDFQTVKHQQKRRNNHRNEGDMDRHNVLTHDAHRQNNQQQRPFHRTLAFCGILTVVEFADNAARKLLRQPRIGNRHRKRTEHRIRQRNPRAALQAFVKHGNNPRLRYIARRIHDVFQRHSRHQSADERTDSQAQYDVYPRQRQHEHNDYCNHYGIHAFSPFQTTCRPSIYILKETS